MNTQRIHRFCLALMVMAMLVRLAGQVEAYLDYKKASAPTLWRVDVEPAPVPLAPVSRKIQRHRRTSRPYRPSRRTSP